MEGTKGSSGDWRNTEPMLKTLGDGAFNVFVGSENFLLKALLSS